jgi:lipid II:glycine glycyltransferase (peptidoglycan interpeptide bridge formation enzyme)
MANSFCLHHLDLRPSVAQLFHRFHKDCVQRKIRRAQQKGLRYEAGNSESLLVEFYNLLVLTRQRQGLPPQPLTWFRNLIAYMGDALKIRMAFNGGLPIASILTLRHKRTIVYKYACSDRRFHNLGGVQLLLWNTIEESSQEGLLQLDFGRSDWDNPGLIAFKDRWGASRSTVVSWRCGDSSARPRASPWQLQMAHSVFAHLPTRLLPIVGGLLYKHLHRP